MIEIAGHGDTAEIAGISRRQYFESRGYDWDKVEEILRLYKAYKAIHYAQVDEHHLAPRSRGGSDWRINRKKIRRWEHVPHHTVFDNKLPHEQIDHVVSFNRKVFQPDIPRRISEIIDDADIRGKLYMPKVFNT